MRIERRKNAVKNIKAGIILRVYQILVPFFMRTAMIYFMGVEYLGLSSLFTSVLSFLNLAELGVGSAMVFAMYRPIAEDDERTICALMALYRRYYRLIGLFIGAAGLALTPFIPRLISGDVPADVNVYLLYLLNLSATVLTYWLFAYKNCLFQAHQRTSVTSRITVLTYTMQWVIQLYILLAVKNYYWYVIATLASQAVNNVITAAAAEKEYPGYKPAGKLDEAEVAIINGKIRDLFTAKLGNVVLKASDTVVISAFMGLTTVAIFQNYNFIAQSVITMCEIVLGSVMAGLGNSFILESKEKNFADMEKFGFIFLWLGGVCVCCFIAMYQPFMELWVGKELMLDYGLLLCFAAYFFVVILNRFVSTYKDAAGLWHEDRYRALITALINLSLNLLWVRRWGLYGILLSTVISMTCVGMPWMLHNLFTLFFNREQLKKFLSLLFGFVAATAAAGLLVSLICNNIDMNPVPALAVSAVTALLVPDVLFFICFCRKKQFIESLLFVESLTKGKLRLTALAGMLEAEKKRS